MDLPVSLPTRLVAPVKLASRKKSVVLLLKPHRPRLFQMQLPAVLLPPKDLIAHLGGGNVSAAATDANRKRMRVSLNATTVPRVTRRCTVGMVRLAMGMMLRTLLFPLPPQTPRMRTVTACQLPASVPGSTRLTPTRVRSASPIVIPTPHSGVMSRMLHVPPRPQARVVMPPRVTATGVMMHASLIVLPLPSKPSLWARFFLRPCRHSLS